MMLVAGKNNTKDMFEKNLSFLFPSLREAVLAVDETELWKRIEITYNDEGYPICRYHEGDTSFLINSERPFEDAKRWYDNVDDHQTGSIFLFGSGFGYSLFEVFDRKQPHTLIVLFEKDIYLFTAMLYYFDLEPIVSAGRLAFIVGDGLCFQEAFDNLFTSFNLAACCYPTIAFTLPAIRNFKEIYLNLIKYLFDQMSIFSAFVGNDHQDNLLGFCNMVANAKEVVKNPYLSCLKDRYKNYPAFIIANGPSLDKSINLLEKIDGKGLVLSVESAILPLMKNNIKPDILTVLERTKETYHYHFENIDYPDDISLLCLSTVDRRVMPSFKGPKIPVFRNYEAINSWINEYLGDGSGINPGVNVSHLALELAVYMGANPIVFVGQDYAYGPELSTHSRDSIYNEERGAKAREIVQSREIIYVEGNNESLVPTNELWYEFKLELERKIAFNSDRTFINVTEGGAKIKGAQRAHLEDVIEKYCKRDIPARVNKLIARSKEKKRIWEIKERFNEFIKVTEKYADQFRSLVHATADGKHECRKNITLSLREDSEKYLETFKSSYLKNNDFFFQLFKTDLYRHFIQQEILANYYLMNRLGIINSKEKITEIFKIQYNFFSYINDVVQSVSVHMENAVHDLKLALREIEEEYGMKTTESLDNKLLSLCITSLNDEKFIKDCILEWEGIADEIIVADMGSNDRTAKIAKARGAVVIKVDESAGFGAIKNMCLDKASGRWVLFLRASERLLIEQKQELIELLGNPNAEGYLLPLENHPEDCLISSPVESLRLVRKRSEYSFKYKSFEAVDGLSTGIYNSYIYIKCLDEAAFLREFDMRTKLLEQEISEKPDNEYLQYMYGIVLLNRQKNEGAAECLAKAFENLNRDVLFAPHLFKFLVWVLLYMGRDDEALEIINEGVEEFPFYTDLLVLRSEVYKKLGKYGDAVSDLENSLELIKVLSFGVPSPEIGESIIYELLDSYSEHGTSNHS